MNPWDLLGIILGWVFVVIVVALLAGLAFVIIGVFVGLAKGGRGHNIMSSKRIHKGKGWRNHE